MILPAVKMHGKECFSTVQHEKHVKCRPQGCPPETLGGLIWDASGVLGGSFGAVLGPQNCPKRPPEDPRSTPDQSPKGVWGTALGPAFLHGFRVALLKNTFFHAFFRPGKIMSMAQGPVACIFTWFSCAAIEKHDFPCIFTSG